MNSRQFLKLQAEWYAKLENDGFIDIESKGQLKTCENLKWVSPSNNRRAEDIQSKFEYYSMAQTFLVDWADIFMSDIQRTIWEMYCDGHGCRAITQQLAIKGIKTNKDYVHWAIRDLKDVMLGLMNVR